MVPRLTDTAATQLRECRTRDERYAIACEIELRAGPWLAIRVQTKNISRGGACVRLPGGACCGEQYRIALSLDSGLVLELDSEVRWVGELDSVGFACVGLKWGNVAPRGRERLDAFLKLIGDR